MSSIGACSEGVHGSIGDWDMSAVTNMESVFRGTSAFNQDLSKWDVSAVTHMGFMFNGASAFKRKLCGVAWVNSKAKKNAMFTNSTGSISSNVCTAAGTGYGEGYGLD